MRTSLFVGLVTLAFLILPSSPALARAQAERVEDRLTLQEELAALDEEIRYTLAQAEADLAQTRELALREIQSTRTPAVKHALAQKMQEDAAAIQERARAKVDRLKGEIALLHALAALPESRRAERECGTREWRCGTGHAEESPLKTWALPLAAVLSVIGAAGALVFARLR